MKKEFYQVLRQNMETSELVLLSVADGAYAGEKLLLSGETVIAADGLEDTEPLFLRKNLQELLPVAATKLAALEEGRVYCERIGNTRKLVLCGGGHVSAAILGMAKMLGFHVTVLDDRLSFVNEAAEKGADEVICDNFVHGLSQINGDKDTYFVIVTRGHRWDADCLREILKKEYAYVGMMGSKKRVFLLKRQLAEEGLPKEKLKNLHAPIGLSIDAETPEEIAVSVMAEIIQEKNREKKIIGYDQKTMRILTGEEETETPFVLATIISRCGSAPREIGTKMIIFSNGKLAGTIGGGCMESEVARAAIRLMRSEAPKQELITVDMTGADAEEEGMVCGGTIEVMLEVMA